MKKSLIIIPFTILIIILLIYFLSLKKTYTTKLGYKIKIPLISKIKEKENYKIKYDENVKLTITSYGRSPEKVINEFVKDFKTYSDPYKKDKIYFYNESEDYTIIINTIDKSFKTKIKLTIYKGNKYETYYNEDRVYSHLYVSNYLGQTKKIIEGTNGLLNIHSNIYLYNIDTFWVAYNSTLPYDYNLEDVFKYNYYKIEDFIDYYEKLISIHYGRIIQNDKYTLYYPEEPRLNGKIEYSILYCNNKYIFGKSDLKYDELLCN